MNTEKCRLCPRKCGVDRKEKKGFCGCGEKIRIAKYMLHYGEEPCIGGKNGSGAVFFSGCSLKCVFCQNEPVSHGCKGEDISDDEFRRILFELKEKNADNIDLVTGSHFIGRIAPVLAECREKLGIPVIFNCSGYEEVSSLKMLEGLIDIYLPDVKYFDSNIAAKYSGASDYPEKVFPALEEMIRQQPDNVFGSDGLMKKGVLIRHLVIPGCYKDSIRIFEKIYEEYKNRLPLISIMRQYTPCGKALHIKEINRKLTSFEYNKVVDRCAQLGFEGFTQEKGCETLDMTPDF